MENFFTDVLRIALCILCTQVQPKPMNFTVFERLKIYHIFETKSFHIW